MPHNVYLTIDDTPSDRSGDLIDFLVANAMPALLFCRGDRMDENIAPVVRAIQAGLVIGNHTYHHRRASTLTVAEEVDEIDRTDALIEKAYKMAGKPRPAKYFRFSYMDRGMGARFVESDGLPPEYRQPIDALMNTGLGSPVQPPDPALIEKKRAIQDHLKKTGYVRVPFENVTVPWYANTEMAQTIDSLCTFSNCDWMLTARHLAKDWPYKTVADLRRHIDADPWLHDPASNHIFLGHDQAEIMDVTLATIRHLKDKGFTFLPIP